MTQLQKDIIEELFKGGSIVANAGKYRLRDKSFNPLRTFNPCTLKPFRKLLRKSATGYAVIDLRKVRQLHGRSWVKQYYKQLKKSSNGTQDNDNAK